MYLELIIIFLIIYRCAISTTFFAIFHAVIAFSFKTILFFLLYVESIIVVCFLDAHIVKIPKSFLDIC